MNKLFFSYLPSLFLVFWVSLSFAQIPEIHFENVQNRSEVSVSNYESTRYHFAFDGLDYIQVETKKGTFTELMLPRGYSVGELGTPKLPARNKLIEIPFGAEVDVKIISYTVTDYRLSDFGVTHPLMPVQPSLRKDQDADAFPFKMQAEYYTKTAFIAPELASVEVLGVMRGQRLGRLTIAPVHYNPAEGVIKVYNSIELEIQYIGANRELTQFIKASTFSPYFDVAYQHVINPIEQRSVFDDYPDLTKYPVKMVIVSHDDFQEALQPFITWKTKQGFEIIEAYTSETGTSAAAIKAFIHEQYNAATPQDPAPTFVIVVGDNIKLPASATGDASGQVTDLYYASVDGDYFPDMYIGRLSARNVQELQNQLDKILYYQQYAFEDPGYLNDVTLIAGSDVYWNPQIGQPTINYGTENYFNAANGFNNVNAYLSSYTGCYDEERISVSLINYTAHCSPTSWGSPLLTTNGIHQLTNAGKYPLAIGNCCQSAMFSHSESIGEAWLRAENKGAVAYIGSAPNTHWFEDFYWSVGAFPIQGNNGGYVPTVEETTPGAYDVQFAGEYHAVAATKFAGNLAITEAHLQGYQTHSNVQWYWEGYHTFGDPSTVIYLTEGKENEVSHMPIVPLGLSSYSVEALPGSYVAVSMNGVLHGAAFVDESGEVEVPIEPILESGDVSIVVTKPQYIPYIQEVPAVGLEGPYVVLDTFIINDQGGTLQAHYGESFTVDVGLKNVGSDPVNEVTAVLTGEDNYIILENPGEAVIFGSMGTGENDNTATVQDAFSFQISMKVPDQHQASFLLTVSDGNEEWTSNLRITANAPVFSINMDYLIDDSVGGNDNGWLDPGESAQMIFDVTNHGHSTARQPVMELAGNSPYFTILEDILEIDPIAPGEKLEIAFSVEAHPSTIQGTPVDLSVHISDGHWFEAETVIIIGQVPEKILGEGMEVASNYPFYNWYKANRSQMLYLSEEIGQGEKVITGLGMDLVHATSTPQHQALPNFTIKVKHTDMESMGSQFVNMDDAAIVFEETIHQMPSSTGWHYWDIESFSYDGSSNIIVEVVWGLLDDYSNFNDHYQVQATDMGSTRAVYGYNDYNENPPYNGNSGVLPNLYMSFASDASDDIYKLGFIVKDSTGNMLEDASVRIGSLTRFTDNQGSTVFDLLPGTYTYLVKKDDYLPQESAISLSEDVTIEIILTIGEVSVAEPEITRLNIYPNPAVTILTVESGEPIFDIRIINMRGEVIYSAGVGRGNSHSINVSGYKSGIYLIQATTSGGVFTSRVQITTQL